MMTPVSQPSITEREWELVREVMDSGWITQGPMVARFEQLLARWLNVSHVVACASGTAALHLALVALGIEPGDEVLIPDLTYVATANAVRYAGATPVLVDVDPWTWGIDCTNATVTPRTKAILPVHLYGVPCNMRAVWNLAWMNRLLVVEDAAEALGAVWDGQPCGTLGDVGAFSFYANKIITTGEGGAAVTASGELAERLRHLRGQAQPTPGVFYHDEVGFNYRMTDLHAALGVAQMERFPDLVAARRGVVDAYFEHIQSCPSPVYGGSSAPWLFTFQLPRHVDVASFRARLRDAGVETRPAFTPLHRMPMYQGDESAFPVASSIADHGVSLPTFPDLPLEEVRRIAELVERLCRRSDERYSA